MNPKEFTIKTMSRSPGHILTNWGNTKVANSEYLGRQLSPNRTPFLFTALNYSLDLRW